MEVLNPERDSKESMVVKMNTHCISSFFCLLSDEIPGQDQPVDVGVYLPYSYRGMCVHHGKGGEQQAWRQERGAELFHLQCQAQHREKELEARSIYKLSNPTLSDMSPSVRMHHPPAPHTTSSCGPMFKYVNLWGTFLTYNSLK